jgi:hypothetical protein
MESEMQRNMTLRDIRHQGTFTLSREDWRRTQFSPRMFFWQRAKFPLYSSDEFDERVIHTLNRVYLSTWTQRQYDFFDIAQKALRPGPMEWEKMRLFPRGRFMAPWEPLLIYWAHRNGLHRVLLEEEDSVNTFYVQIGMVVYAVDIEYCTEEDALPGEEEFYYRIGARGIGDDLYMPDKQRLFIASV